MTQEEYIQALRDLLRADHARWIVEAQQYADEAGAAGHVESQKRWLDEVDRQKATRFPWERTQAA
jgi:hypothetical protein